MAACSISHACNATSSFHFAHQQGNEIQSALHPAMLFGSGQTGTQHVLHGPQWFLNGAALKTVIQACRLFAAHHISLPYGYLERCFKRLQNTAGDWITALHSVRDSL